MRWADLYDTSNGMAVVLLTFALETPCFLALTLLIDTHVPEEGAQGNNWLAQAAQLAASGVKAVGRRVKGVNRATVAPDEAGGGGQAEEGLLVGDGGGRADVEVDTARRSGAVPEAEDVAYERWGCILDCLQCAPLSQLLQLHLLRNLPLPTPHSLG